MMPEPQCNTVHDVPTRFVRREKWRRMRGFNHLAKVIKGLPTICQQLLRGYNPAIKFQLNAMRRVHVLGNPDQIFVGL